MSLRIRGSLGTIALFAALISATPAAAASPNASQPQPVADDQLKALTTELGGAKPLPTDRTIAHWFGQTENPDDGVTYGYNMAGADPDSCSGSACDVTTRSISPPSSWTSAG